MRDSSDGNTDCDAEGDATAVETDWVQGCSAAPSSFDLAGSTTMLEDGAAISFNRYGDNTPCSNGSEEGIARFVMFPSNGMPYSKLPNQ